MLLLIVLAVLLIALFGGLGVLLHPLFWLGILVAFLVGGLGWFGHRHY
jgi:cobalamin biosynthesis protein CobD/CbiB